MNNKCSNNYFAGISADGGSILIQNELSNNHHIGTLLRSSPSYGNNFCMSNTARSNGLQPSGTSSFTAGDFTFDGINSTYAPIIDVSSMGNLTNNASTNFEWANFKY